MAHEVVMPQMGLSMDSGQIIRWLKQPGEFVRPGELLLEVESDKSIVEVEAIETGVLHILLGPEAGDIPVGQVIALLLTEGEKLPGEAQQPGAPVAEPVAASDEPATQETRLAPSPRSTGEYYRRPPSSPAARRRAAELGLDWRQAAPSGVRGQVKERDILALAARPQPSFAPPAPSAAPAQFTPVARRMAEATGLDLEQVARLHPDKKLERADVEQTLRQIVLDSSPRQVESQPAPTMEPQVSLPANLPSHRQPLTSLRRLIAGRMAYSSQATAAVTLTTRADATDLVRMRDGWKADGRAKAIPSYNVIIAALVAKALLEHPILNASIDGNEIVYWDTVNIGVAVDTPRGLVVPVLCDVQEKPLGVLAEEAEGLLQRAAEGKALPDELSGSTFTITNLGVQEIDAFTPVINPPECAVLGIGRFVKEIIALNDLPAVRTMVALSLTFDHRLVDGAPAARFLQRVKQFVEQPYLWLI